MMIFTLGLLVGTIVGGLVTLNNRAWVAGLVSYVKNWIKRK